MVQLEERGEGALLVILHQQFPWIVEKIQCQLAIYARSGHRQEHRLRRDPTQRQSSVRQRKQK